MDLKFDDNGNVVVQDGKPVYVDEDGKDVPFDANYSQKTISKLNREAQEHRERAETAEKSLKAFGEMDPKEAKKALDTVSKLDQKELMDAGEVDQVKEDIAKSYQGKIDELNQTVEGLNSTLHQEKIGGAFARSKYIADNLALPADMIQAKFGGQFSLDNGQLVAHDGYGNAIYSRERPGEYADFDEAMEKIVEEYPNKDEIKRAKSPGGMGSSGQGGSAPAKGDIGGSREERLAYIREQTAKEG